MKQNGTNKRLRASRVAHTASRGTGDVRRIYLIGDQPVTRAGLAQLIDLEPDLEVCGQAGTTSEAAAQVAALRPNLVILNVTPAESNLLDLIKQLRSAHPDLGILVLSPRDAAHYAERAVRAGAQGYVMNQASTAEILTAMRQVLEGKLHLSEAVRLRLVHHHLRGPARGEGAEMESLSDRELEVFEFIGRGRTSRWIAEKLKLSVSTVETHRVHLKRKLGLTNGMALVRRAVEWVNSRGQ